MDALVNFALPQNIFSGDFDYVDDEDGNDFNFSMSNVVIL